jgi:hypothetical protein
METIYRSQVKRIKAVSRGRALTRGRDEQIGQRAQNTLGTAPVEEFIDLPMGLIDRGIAAKLIEDRVPIHGAEVAFLRKALGLSLKDWASPFGLSAAGVLKWEKAPTKRLAPVNEAAVRAYCAEHLGVEVSGIWSELVAADKIPSKISVRLKGKAA